MENVDLVLEFLYIAYKRYQEDVVQHHMLYERFMSLFLETSNQITDGESEVALRYRMNHVRELLTNRPSVAQYYFARENLSVSDMQTILNVINKVKKGTHVSERPTQKAKKKSSEVYMDDVQMAKVVTFANNKHIFKNTITAEDLRGFFSDERKVLHANSNKDAALFFEALTAAQLIAGFGTTTIGRRGNLIRSSGEEVIQGRDLANPLSKHRGSKTLEKWTDAMRKIAAGEPLNLD